MKTREPRAEKGNIIVRSRSLFEELRSLKGGLTWSGFLRLLLSLYKIIILDNVDLRPNVEAYRLAVELRERSPPTIRLRRVKTGRLVEGRHWVRKYVGREVYSVTVFKGYDSVSVWVARVDDRLVLINIRSNFINPVPREAYMDMLKLALSEAFKRICTNSETACKSFTVDPEMPLDPEVSRELEDWLNRARERFYETLREITGVKTLVH
jgi:hypothetical protein